MTETCELCGHAEADHQIDSACPCLVAGCSCNLAARVDAAGGLSEWLRISGTQPVVVDRGRVFVVELSGVDA